MSCYAGITTRPKERKEEQKRNYPTLKKWKIFGPFKNRQNAQKWEDKQNKCKTHRGGNTPLNPDAKWHGYKFYF